MLIIQKIIHKINTLNIPIEKRIKFKKFFLNEYQQEYISTFIDNL